MNQTYGRMSEATRGLVHHMDASIMTAQARQFSPCASLAALGVSLQERDVFGPIRERVMIAQMTVKHTPLDKVYDVFITLLAGANGLVEINTRLRSDRVLQATFGSASGAEQSVVLQALYACTTANIGQLEQAPQPSTGGMAKAIGMTIARSGRSWMSI